MEELKEFAAEVCRVEQSSYSPSLKILHNILQKLNPCILQHWARWNPCQIDPLAAAVLDSIELWPFALDALRILAFVPSFRDAVLHQQPMLLDTLLAKATESESGFEKYAPTCVTLLSSPTTATIPASFLLFLAHLVARAVVSITPETIRPIHQVLTALGSYYLDVLPLDVINSLESRMVEVLSKLESDDRLGNLLCLAVLAKLATNPVDQSDEKQDSLIRRGRARKFFEGKRGQKTLDLVILRAITACSGNCPLSSSDICKSFELSIEILHTFHINEKTVWVAKNTSKIKKLHQKTLMPSVGAELQCMAINLLASLSDGEGLPHDLFIPLDDDPSKITILLPCVVKQYIGQAREEFVHGLLQNLLRGASHREHVSGASCLYIQNSLSLVSVITELIPAMPTLRRAISNFVSGDKAPYSFDQLADPDSKSSSTRDEHSKTGCCPSAYANSKLQLQQKLIFMVLRAALQDDKSNKDYQKYHLLLEKQTVLHSTSHSCTDFLTPRKATHVAVVSLFEAESTPQDNSISHGWRDKLTREMSRDANCRYESVVRMVSEICRDLESRCNEVERPLRDERSRASMLQFELDRSQERIVNLESQAELRKIEAQDRIRERDQLSNQIKTGEGCIQELRERMDCVRQDLDQVRNQAANAARSAVEAARQQDLAYIATLTGKDELLEEQALTLAAREERNARAEEELLNLRTQASRDVRTLQEKDSLLADYKRATTEASDLAGSRQAAIDILAESERLLKIANLELSEKLDNSSSIYKSHVWKLKNESEIAKAKNIEMQKEYQAYVRSKSEEISQLKEDHDIEVAGLRESLSEFTRRAEVAKTDSLSTVNGLRTSIKRLCRELERCTKERDEAQELRSRLVAMVGMAKDPPVRHNTQLIPSRDTAQTPFATADTPDDRHSSLHTNDSFDSNALTKSGPTSKRKKFHRSSGTPSNPTKTASEFSDATRTDIRTSIRGNRSPLAELSSKKHQGWSIPAHHIRERAVEFGVVSAERLLEREPIGGKIVPDDESFGEDDIFTSPDQRQLSALRHKTPQAMFDGITTEF